MLPTWFRPIPPLFVVTLLVGAVVSLVCAIVAGVRGSRLWFAAALLPIAFFLMLLNFEQATEVRLRNDFGTPTFVLSGSGKLSEFVVFSPEYLSVAESPNDMKFALWCVKPADHQRWGEPLWRLRTIRYGFLPEGYIQCAPLEGKPEPLRDSQAPYFLNITTANAPGASGYFSVESGMAHWLTNPPNGPCFSMDHGQYKRVDCLDSTR
jgi:hypothetical protein